MNRIDQLLQQMITETTQQVLPTVYSATMLTGLQELQSLTDSIAAQRLLAGETPESRDTLVIAGMGNTIPRIVMIDGQPVQVTAWHSGNALAAKDRMEDFIREVSYGHTDDPQTAAADLMDEMGWA